MKLDSGAQRKDTACATSSGTPTLLTIAFSAILATSSRPLPALAMSVGTPALDGLGFVGGDFHTDHEWIDLASVTPRLYLFTRLLMEVSAKPPP